MLERLLTPSDGADRCQVSTKTVLRAIHRGHLRASRLGEQGAYRIREADAESWIDACVLEAAALPRVAVPPAPRGGEPPLNGRLVLTRDMGRS
jgi:excisionase family DNA binding protein